MEPQGVAFKHRLSRSEMMPISGRKFKVHELEKIERTI